MMDEIKNVLIFGNKGQLGTEITRMIESKEAEIGQISNAYNKARVYGFDLPEIDITNSEQVDSLLDKYNPQIVFNCAAYTNVDGCEANYDVAYASNAIGAEVVALACEKKKCNLVHVSTDYVFSGSDEGERVETDSPAPISAYGKTKRAGEEKVLEACKSAHITRTAWLYGIYGKNFVKTMISLADSKSEISVVDDQYGNPTSVNDLAYELLKIGMDTENYGIWHVTGEGICTWADLAEKAINLAGKNCKVKRVTSEQYKTMNPKSADRPKYSSLRNQKLIDTIGNDMRNWEVALADYIKKLNN